MSKINKLISYLTLAVFILLGNFFIITTCHTAGDDINIIQPQLQVNIPGVNFSDATEVEKYTREEADGTYLYIPYLGEYISQVYKYAIAAATILVLIRIMDGGFGWVISGGNAEKIKESKKKIGQGLVGLTLAILSYALLYTLNPDLVTFRSLRISYIPEKTFEYELNIAGEIAETSYTRYPQSFPKIINGQFSPGLIIPTESSSNQICISNKKRCATQEIRDMAYTAQLETGYPGAVLIAQYMLEGSTFGIKCKSGFEPSTRDDSNAKTTLNCESRQSCSPGYTWECTKKFSPVLNNKEDFKNGKTIDCGVGSKQGQGFIQVHGYACFNTPPKGTNIFISLINFYEKRKSDCFRKARDNYGGNPYAFAVEVQKCGYATAQNYAQTLHKFMEKYNLIGVDQTKPSIQESNLNKPINLDEIIKADTTDNTQTQ